MEAKVLTAQSLCKRYGTLDALDHVDLTLEPGHIYGLIGRNGAGKTTLLSALTAQMPVDAGTVTYGGAPVWENEAVLGELCFSRELGSTVGGMNNALKVKDYLNAGRLFYPHWDETYAQKLITQFKLAPKKRISALSKGMASMLTIVLVRQPRRLPKWMLPVLDAVGLAVFVGIGVNKAFNAEAGPLIAVCMGVITGVGGGIIRDVLAREIPMILRTEIYATACIIGGIVHATAYYTFSVPLETASMMGMVVTLLIRLAAIRWHLKLPTFALDENGR